jgi:hypothetical protein
MFTLLNFPKILYSIKAGADEIIILRI